MKRIARFLFLLALLPAHARVPDDPLRLGDFETSRGKVPILITAPHEGYDVRTGPIASEMARRLGASSIVASGFRKKDHPINVNRPTEGIGRHWSEEEQTEEAAKVYRKFRDVCRETCPSPEIYVEVHGQSRAESAGRIETATVGISRGEAVVLEKAYADALKNLGRSRPPLILELALEPTQDIYFSASAAKGMGTLALYPTCLHFELPAEVRKDAKAARLYAKVLARVVQVLQERRRSTQVWVVPQLEGGEPSWTGAPTPVVGEKALLHALVKYKGKLYASAYPAEWQGVRVQRSLRGDPAKLPEEVEIRWSRVEAMTRNQGYDNTKPFEHWDLVRYREVPFVEPGDGWTVEAQPAPAEPGAHPERPAGVGTTWYKASVRIGDEVYESPGTEAVRLGTLGDEVCRVSWRGDTGNDVLDWGLALCHVPYIYGSRHEGSDDTTHQSERFAGADCADFVVSAYRHANGPRLAYTWTGGLARVSTKLAETPGAGTDGVFLDGAGNPITWPAVARADIILYDDHVGLLFADRSDPASPQQGGPNRTLDRWDLLLHTAGTFPVLQPLGAYHDQKFEIRRLP